MAETNYFSNNPVCRILGIRFPICQAGMYSVAYGKLAAAVSNAGGLGVIGSAFMTAKELRKEIRLVKNATDKIGQTVEGLKTLKVVKMLSDERNINMPIVDSLYKIIYKGDNLDGSIRNILGEDLIKDVEFFK